MQRAVVVVGVGDADQVGDRPAPKKTFWTLSVWPPEQAEKKVSAILPPYVDDLAAGRFGGRVGRRGLAVEPLVDLAAGVVVEVEAVAADAGR